MVFKLKPEKMMVLCRLKQNTNYYRLLLHRLEVHSAETKVFQSSRFFAFAFICDHVRFSSTLENSSCTLRRHEPFGRPLRRRPWVFQSSAILLTSFGGFRMVCPIHLHFLSCISRAIGFCALLVRRSSLEIQLSGHHIRRIDRSSRIPSIFRIRISALTQRSS